MSALNWWTHIWVLAFNSLEALTTNGIAMHPLYDFLSGNIISCFYLPCIRVLISQHLCQCLWSGTRSGILLEFGSDCPDLFCDILITSDDKVCFESEGGASHQVTKISHRGFEGQDR